MKINSHTVEVTTTEKFYIDLENGRGIITYIEYINSKGRVVDTSMLDEMDIEMDDENCSRFTSLTEEVELLVQEYKLSSRSQPKS